MRFVFVDRIVDLVPGKRIQTIKNVSASEDYFTDHFPGVAIMPGALILECIMQSAILMLSAEADFSRRPVVTRIRRAAFKQFVRPGDQLVVRCETDDRRLVRGSVMVDGRSVAAALVEFQAGPAEPLEKPIQKLYETVRVDPNNLAGWAEEP